LEEKVMKSAYDKVDAEKIFKKYPEISQELALRIYTSQLIGSDPDLVMHGGGNTSIKLTQKNILGEEQEVLFVKGSGIDLANITPEGFVGLDLAYLRKLRRVENLEDEGMEIQLEIHKLHRSPQNPSVEALLHAFLPPKYIDHTHADSILILTNQPKAANLVKKALGPRIAVLPYTMSGLPLAKAVAAQYEKRPDLEAIVIINHGIFTFGEDAITSYERMIDCVNRAEKYVNRSAKGTSLVTPRTDITIAKDEKSSAARLAQVIRGSCAHRGSDGRLRRQIVEFRDKPDLLAVSLSQEAPTLCDSGVITPDHVIRTKNKIAYLDYVPEADNNLKEQVNQIVEDYVKNYHRYYRQQVKAKGVDRKELDPFPRVFLAAGLGLFTLGFSRNEAKVAADIAEHTIYAKVRAGRLGNYVPITDSHVFDMEYWSLQQRKLSHILPPLLQGQIALITGAGGAIGFGIADRLLAAGAAVVLSDIDEFRIQKVRSILEERYEKAEIEIIPFDVTDYHSVEAAFDQISRRLGGVDIVVPNAGIAWVAKIEDLDPLKMDQVISVNLKGTFNTIKASIPVFRRQSTGGNIVVVSSKNVFDPGAAFGAYSASKAGAHQISKIAALELAELGVRVNMVNPDAVFGDEEVSSKLWDLVGPDRMKSRGLDYEGLKEYYRNRNLLKTQVLAEHVGNVVVFFASDLTPTTGTSFPVDGGIPAAFPR
jgi:rhamnose utilization protein RhaD (predicted bifunctional aldolase and dehydrogenase)/NAD(P)-dependent dehydrogenase (short-subunit alcohol dehydrogenase family)